RFGLPGTGLFRPPGSNLVKADFKKPRKSPSPGFLRFLTRLGDPSVIGYAQGVYRLRLIPPGARCSRLRSGFISSVSANMLSALLKTILASLFYRTSQT